MHAFLTAPRKNSGLLSIPTAKEGGIENRNPRVSKHSREVDDLLNKSWFLHEQLNWLLQRFRQKDQYITGARYRLLDHAAGSSLILAHAGSNTVSGTERRPGDNPLSFSFWAERKLELVLEFDVHDRSRISAALGALEKRVGWAIESFKWEDVRAPQPKEIIRHYTKLICLNNAESAGHLQRVAAYSRWIATHFAPYYQLGTEWVARLCAYAPLHDIGKVFVPVEILSKAGSLSADEIARVKLHTSRGASLVNNLAWMLGGKSKVYRLDILSNVVACHHEAMDGGGYPRGLRGESIPLEARIVAVADILDALLSRRAYKPAWSMDATLKELQRLSGTRLDPILVDFVLTNSTYLPALRKHAVIHAGKLKPFSAEKDFCVHKPDLKSV